MEAKLVINGVDFAPWCKKNCVQQTDVVRRSRRVTALDGTIYERKIIKRGIQVTLVELRDGTLRRLASALSSPASVRYTDRDYGERTGYFLISGLQGSEKTVRGGNTYWSGVSFNLEER